MSRPASWGLQAAQASPPGMRVVQNRWVSFRATKRSILVSAVLALSLAAMGVWSLAVGDFPLSLSQVSAALVGGGETQAGFVVRTLRLPRVITGALVGAALGMSGAALQSLARNPLGSPDIIGFDRGAAVGAVAVITVFGSSGIEVAVGAVVGGLIATLLVYVLAWKRGVRSYRLVLMGIGMGFTATALVDYLLIRAEINDLTQATVWLTGSLNGRSWEQVTMMTVGLVLLGPAVIALQRTLDRLALGDEIAAALGTSVNLAKLGVILSAVALAALAVAAAGPISFVAFVAAPIARRLIAAPAAAAVGTAALVGAFVTVAGDLAARELFPPHQVPVGIATSVIGAPYLLWVLARQAKEGQL